MSDLISRKDAVELLKNDMENNGLPLDDEYNIGIDHAMCLLACVPTTDLVRCGECEYADEYNHCKYSAWWNGNADFCSHGIRRKESQ